MHTTIVPSRSILQRLQDSYVFYPWKEWSHQFLCPPLLFTKGQGLEQEIIFLNGLTYLGHVTLDWIEAGWPQERSEEEREMEMDEEDRQDFLRERGESNPRWQPIPEGGYRYVGPERTTPIRRSLSDVSIQPHFPNEEGLRHEDYERTLRRVERLAQKETRSPMEEQALSRSLARLAHHRFFAMARAAQDITFHGKTPLEAVLQYPEHHQKLVSGKLPLHVYARGAQLFEDTTAPNLLETQLEHLVKSSVSPAAETQPTPAAPIAQPPTNAAFQKAMLANQPARDDLAREMTERAIRAQQALPADQRLSYDEVAQIMRQQYGNASHEQFAAITDPAAQRAFWAGPGAGKTTTIKGAVGEMMLRRDVHPEQLHFISTTHTGVQALRQGVTGSVGQIFPQMVTKEYQNRHYRTLQSLAMSEINKRHGGTSAVEQMMGHNARLLGPANGSLDNAKSIEEALRSFEEGQEEYIRNLINTHRLDKQVSVKTTLSKINELKGDMGSAAYKQKLEEGQKLWEQGGTAQSHPHALLYAYEQALQNQKGFAPMSQRQRRYDLNDAIDIWKRAGLEGKTPKLGGLVVDEAQELSPSMISAIWANTTAQTPMILAGDMGQRIMGKARVDKLLRRLRDRDIVPHHFTANFRSSQQIVAHSRGIYEDPGLQAYGTSHSQVGMSGRVGEEPQYLLGSSFQTAHASAMARWFREMEMDPEAIRTNLEYGQSPFAFGKRQAREMPFIVSQKEERKLLREALETHLKGMGLSSREIAQITEKGVFEGTPGSAGSSEHQMHLLTTQQARSLEFPVVFGSATRGGQWDDPTWQAEQAIKASRAIEQLYWFGTDKNFDRTGFNNRFEALPGSNQLVPAGHRAITSRAARAMIGTQGLSPEDLSQAMQFASLDQGMGSQQYITPEQGEALLAAFGDAIDQQKAFPVIKRAAMPVVGSGSGFLAMSKAEAETPAEDGEAGVLQGFLPYGGSAMAAANADPRLIPDERLMGLAGRYAEELFHQPMNAPHQFSGKQIASISEFMQAARQSMDRVSSSAWHGEDKGPDNIDLFNEMLAQEVEQREIDSGRKNKNDEGLGIEPWLYGTEWGDNQRFATTLGEFLDDPQVQADPMLAQVMGKQALETEGLLKAGGHHLADYHLREIARVAREMAMHSEPFSADPEEDQKLRAYYTSLAMQAEAHAGNAPQPGESVRISEEEFAEIIRRDPRQAETLFRTLGDPDAPKGEIRLLDPEHPKAKKQMARHLAQAKFSTLRTVSTPEEGHQLGVSWGYSAAAPHMAELALDSQRLMTHGVRDLENVSTTPGNVEAGIPEQTMQLGGTAGLGQLEHRLIDQMRLSGVASPDQRDMLSQIQAVQQAALDPRRQEAWGHTLNQVFKFTTGNAPTYGDTPSGLSQQFHSFYSPMREASQSGQRTFEQVQRFQEVLDDLTHEVQHRGVLNLGKIKRLLSAMQLDSQNPMFKGLPLLKAAGFSSNESEMPLYSLTDPNNAVNALSHLPSAERGRLLEQFTRAPHLMGQAYEFRGGQKGFSGLTRQQREILQQLGIRPGTTVKGTLRPFSKKDPVGAAILKGGYVAKHLFTSQEEMDASKKMGRDTLLPPAYQLEIEGQHAGARMHVRADQLTTAFGSGNGGLPPVPPPVAESFQEPEDKGSSLHPQAQQAVARLMEGMTPGAQKKLLASLHPTIRNQVLWATPKQYLSQANRRLVERKYPEITPPVETRKEEEKPIAKTSDNVVPPNYPRDITSTQFLDQVAINPPAYYEKPSQVIQEQLQKAVQSGVPQHGPLSSPVSIEGAHAAPSLSHPAGAASSPFSLPVGVAPLPEHIERQRQGPGGSTMRDFVMSGLPQRGRTIREQARRRRTSHRVRKGMLLPEQEPRLVRPEASIGHLTMMGQLTVPPQIAHPLLPPPGIHTPEEEIAPPHLADQKADLAYMIRHGHPGRASYPPPYEEQRGVYESSQPNLLVKAGPGSGKTHTVVSKSVLEAIQPGRSPRNWLFMSALHSGVGELNKTIDRMRPDFPQQQKEYQFAHASTFAALGRKIISKDAQPDEDQETRYPWLEQLSQMRETGPEQERIFAPGVQWSGQAIHRLSAQERRDIPPEERDDLIEPEPFLYGALQPYVDQFNLPQLHPQNIKDYLQAIEVAKSNRLGTPDDEYSTSYQKGQQDLAQGRLSGDTALVLMQQRMAKEGHLEFSDFPYLASQMMDEFGMQAVPEHLQGLQGATVDEGQDISRVELGMLGRLFKTVGVNNPRMIVGYDPMQTSRSAFGGLDPHHIEEEYTRAIGPFEQHTLTENRRSNRGVVSLNNAFLQHSALKDVAKSPIQHAHSSELGAPPRFHEAPHQPAMHEQMLENILKDAGISFGAIQENLDFGQHALHGLDFTRKGVVAPDKIAAIFSQHRDREGFEFETQRRFQNRLRLQGRNLSKEEAERVYRQIFRTDKDKPDPRKIVTTLQAGARSHAYSRVHADVSHVGGSDVPQHLQQNYIAMSRADLEGRNDLYFTQRPLNKENQKVYQAHPDLLQPTSRGTWSLGKHPSGRVRSVSADPRNKPDELAGVRLPTHFAEAMETHIQDLLQQGDSPYHPYFQEMGFQPFAVQQAGALGIIPRAAYQVPEILGPRFWARKDLAGARQQLAPQERQDIAQTMASYPQSLVEEFADDVTRARQFPNALPPDLKEWLEDQASHQGQLRGIHAHDPARLMEAAGKQQVALHLAKNLPAFQAQIDTHMAAQSVPPPAPAGVGAGTAPPHTGDNPTPTIHADQVNIAGGSGMNINIAGGPSGTGPGKGAPPPPSASAGTGTPPPPPPGPMIWDAQKGGFTSQQPGGLDGQAMPRRGGGLGPVYDTPTTGGRGGYSGGFNNQFVQGGRTIARIGDELAYMGQHMQKTADDALQEGSQYRLATLQIPRQPGATTDTYGHTYANLNQGKNQTEPGAANVFSQVWNAITNPDQLGKQIGAAMFGDRSKLTDSQKALEQQEQQGFWGDVATGHWSKIWNEITQGSAMQKSPATQNTKSDSSGTSAGGDNGTQGFFDFTDTDNPNTIGYLQKHMLPMFSDTQIAQQIQAYQASTNQGFSRGAVNATTDISALSAMTGMDSGSLTSQMTDITGMLHNASGSNMAMQNLAGILHTTFKGNMNEQNVSPYLSAMDSVIGNLQGIAPNQTTLAPVVSPISQVPQAAAMFQMALNAGYSAQNLPEVANMVNGLVGVGTSPNLHQQYALSQMFGAQNMTASPELAQYNQQMLGYQQQLSGMQLEQKLNVSQLHIQADNAQIESDKFNLQQATFSLAQNQASFNFGQWMQTQQYGPIGQDTSRSSYFDFLRRQMAAGYDPTNADSASTFKPSQPFGLKNEEFYQGIENQRSMLVLGRSPLLADAAFQQQMKNLNQQENFYERELALQNDQRAFEKTQGQQQLAMQAKALDIQKKDLPTQLAQLEYDKAQTALQEKYLPQQMTALQAIITNTQQSMNGEGPVGGKNVTPMQIIEQMEAFFKADKSQGHQATLNRIQSLGLSTADNGMLFNMLSANQNLSPSQLIGMLAAQGDSGLLKDLQNLNAQGATAAQTQAAGQANANLQQGGVGQNWDQLVQAMNDDKDAANNLATAMSGTTGLTKHMADLTQALSPATTGIGTLSNILGSIAAFAGGGAGGGGLGMGGGMGMSFGEGGVAGAVMSTPLRAPAPPPPGGNNLAEGQDNSTVSHGVRANVLDFFQTLIRKRDEKRYGKRGQSPDASGNEMNYGIMTPHLIKDYRAAMAYGIHQGVDFAASEGTPLAAFFPGKVVGAGHFPWGGEIDLTLPGGYIQRYLHLSQIGASMGQEVKAGQHIGATGGGTPASGLGKWSTGSHLHTQIDRGNINAGYDPWPIWQRLKAKNFVQDLTAATMNVSGVASAGTPVNVPGTVESWIKTAMALTNVPPAWLSDLEIIAMHESGGRPDAINLYDSNARAGHPSQGLFQTIPSTFQAHMLPGYGNILNPIDNAIAGIRYIEGRYGSVYNVPGIVSMSHGGPYVGYADGGIAYGKQIAHVAEKEPEAIIPLSKIQKVMSSLATETTPTAKSGGGNTITIQSMIGSATFHVTASGTGGHMSDTDKDAFMTDLFGVLSDALRQTLGKI